MPGELDAPTANSASGEDLGKKTADSREIRGFSFPPHMLRMGSRALAPCVTLGPKRSRDRSESWIGLKNKVWGDGCPIGLPVSRMNPALFRRPTRGACGQRVVWALLARLASQRRAGRRLAHIRRISFEHPPNEKLSWRTGVPGEPCRPPGASCKTGISGSRDIADS